MNIDGSVALVTGGASGLGRATVERLAFAGAIVVAVDIADNTGTAVEPDLTGRVHLRAADVRNEDAIQEVVKFASTLGPLRIVVNCAGVVSSSRLVGRAGPTSLEEFRRVVEINLLGTVNVMRLAAAEMIAGPLPGEERGVIVNTASVAAYDGQIGQTAYAASKGAIASMTLPAARDLAQSHIRVMSIAPGIFETPMLMGMSDEVRGSLGAQVPHPSRLGKAEEFAHLVAHIVENPMLNGETIRLDGAIRMAPR